MDEGWCDINGSFKDGLAFCGLIARHRPDLIDMSVLRKDNPMHNLKLAFDIAEKELDIPKMLDPEDLCEVVKPDERAVMTYVSAYYHAFSSSQEAEQASNRIQKVIDITRENEQMMEEFESNADALLKWIKEKTDELGERSPYDEMGATKSTLDAFNNYRTVEKAGKAEEKAQLEVKLNTLQTKLRVSNRPAYQPKEGCSIADVNTKWKLLDVAETEREDFIYSEIKRLVHLELSAAKFYNKARMQDAWTEGKESALSANDIGSASLASVLAMTKQHEAFVSDFNAKQIRITQLTDLAKELESLRYTKMNEINSRLSAIKEINSKIEELSNQRRQRLEEAEARLMHIDQLRLDWAKKASPFNNYMEFIAEELTDVFQVTSIEEVETLLADLERIKGDIVKKQGEHDELAAIISELESLGVDPSNPYTTLTSEHLESIWQELQTTNVEARHNKLTKELERQHTRESIRVAFANKANEIGPWLEGESEKLASIAINVQGSLEDHLKALKQEEELIINYKSNLDDIEVAHQQVQEALILKNPHAKYSMQSLRVQYQQLRNAAGHNINAIENQILTRDAMGVGEEQVQEFRQSFNHFDKDGSGQLDRNEFKACLLSLGYNLGDDQEAALNKLMKNVAQFEEDDTSGHVPFTNFLDFMIRQSTAEDTAEQVKSSFKVLAGDKPYITADEIRVNMQPEMAEYCIARMGPYTGDGAPEGALDYNTFALALYSTTQVLRPINA